MSFSFVHWHQWHPHSPLRLVRSVSPNVVPVIGNGVVLDAITFKLGVIEGIVLLTISSTGVLFSGGLTIRTASSKDLSVKSNLPLKIFLNRAMI